MSEQPNRLVYRGLQAPSSQKPTIEVLSARCAVFEESTRLGEYDLDEFNKTFGQFTPGNLVSYDYLGMFRSYHLGRLKLSPQFKHSAKSRSLKVILTDFRIALAFPPSAVSQPAASQPTSANDPLRKRVLEALVINAGMDFATHVVPDPVTTEALQKADQWQRFVAASAKRGPIARLEVHHEGPVVVDADDLTSVGLTAADFHAQKMRLYCDGQEMPILARTDGAGSRKLVFHASPFAEHEIHSRSYYLVADADEPTSSPKRMERLSLSSHAQTQQTGRGIVDLQPRLLYHHRIAIRNGFSHWYWMAIPRGEFRTVLLNLPDLASKGEDPVLELFLPAMEGQAAGKCVLYLNHEKVGAIEWPAGAHHVYSEAIPLSKWKEGENLLSLEFSNAGMKESAESIYLSRCRVEYPQELKAVDGTLHSLIKPGRDAALSLAGFDSKPIVIIANNGKPPVEAEVASTDDGEWQASVAGDEEVDVWAFVPSAGRHPAIVEKVTEQDAHATLADADTVIIAPRSWLPALKPLEEHRKSRGAKVASVALEDVLLWYGFGQKRPLAIRNFLRSLYFGANGPRLTGAVLVGESSDLAGPPEDFPDEASRDIMPVFFREKPLSEPRGDHGYGLMNDGDNLGDIAISRIPASDVEQLSAAIQKIIRYENDSTPGAWRARNFFVVDDEPEFEQAVAELKQSSLPPQYQTVDLRQVDYPYIHMYDAGEKKSAPEASADVIEKINEGALTMLYMGHGGPNILSHERLYHMNQMPQLNNADKPTFLNMGSCDTAWLDYPFEPGKFSLGERFVLHPNGGAIGVFAPVGGATCSDHLVLFRSLYSGIFKHGIHRLGDASLYAVLQYSISSPYGTLPEQYVLLGDSLTLLAVPTRTIQMRVDPAQHLYRKPSTAQVTAEWPDAQAETATVFLRAEGKTQVLAEGVPFTNGIMSCSVPLPANLPEGRHSLSVYAQGKGASAEAIGHTEFAVILSNLKLTIDSAPPEMPHQASQDAKVAFTIQNRSAQQFNDVSLVVRAVGSAQQPMLQKLSLKPFEVLKRNMTVRLAPGIRALDFYALENGTALDSATDEQHARLVFPVLRQAHNKAQIESLGDLIEIASLDVAAMKPLAFNLPLWNLGSAPSSPLKVTLKDEQGTPLGRGVELPAGIDPGEKIVARLQHNKGLAPGKHLIQATVEPATSQPVATQPMSQPASRPTTQPLLTIAREIEIEAGADLVFVPDSMRFESRNFFDGHTVFICAELRNAGTQRSKPCRLEAYKSADTSLRNVISSAIDKKSWEVQALEPGESTPVRVRWDNSHSVGKRTIRLVVNSDKNASESNYENNSIEKELTLEGLPNVQLVDKNLSVEPQVARLGQKVRLSAEIMTDKPQDLSELRVAFSGGPHALSTELLGDPLQVTSPTQTLRYPVSMETTVAEDRHFFTVDANDKRHVIDTSPADNTASANVDLLMRLDELKRKGDAYDLLQSANAAQFDGTYLGPDNQIHGTDLSDRTGKEVKLTTDTLRGEFVTQSNDRATSDSKWLWRRDWIEASPEEVVPPIQIVGDFPETPARAYDVYMLVVTNANFTPGRRASILTVQLPGSEKFERFDFSNDVLPWKSIRYSVGKAAREGTHFEMSLGHEKGDAWTVVQSFELVPLTSTYSSPFIELDDAAAQLRLRAEVDTPDDSAVEFSVRFGEVVEGQARWNEWQSVNLADQEDGDGLASPLIAAQGKVVQWRAQLLQSVKGSPSIRSLGFEVD